VPIVFVQVFAELLRAQITSAKFYSTVSFATCIQRNKVNFFTRYSIIAPYVCLLSNVTG